MGILERFLKPISSIGHVDDARLLVSYEKELYYLSINQYITRKEMEILIKKFPEKQELIIKETFRVLETILGFLNNGKNDLFESVDIDLQTGKMNLKLSNFLNRYSTHGLFEKAVTDFFNNLDDKERVWLGAIEERLKKLSIALYYCNEISQLKKVFVFDERENHFDSDSMRSEVEQIKHQIIDAVFKKDPKLLDMYFEEFLDRHMRNIAKDWISVIKIDCCLYQKKSFIVSHLRELFNNRLEAKISFSRDPYYDELLRSREEFVIKKGITFDRGNLVDGVVNITSYKAEKIDIIIEDHTFAGFVLGMFGWLTWTGKRTSSEVRFTDEQKISYLKSYILEQDLFSFECKDIVVKTDIFDSSKGRLEFDLEQNHYIVIPL